jgi:hypothetical protein
LSILTFAWPWSAEAQDSAAEILKRQLSLPIVLRVEQFQLPTGTYLAAVMRESFLPGPRIRIFLVTGASLAEVYETMGGGEELVDLQTIDLTGDNMPEVVTTWLCGQRGLKCVKILAWESKTRRFREVFDAQASDVELGPKQQGKPIEIVLVDGDNTPKASMPKKRVYVWQRGKFIRKAGPR